jgi:glycolate oxidase iron-sulfur subunit
LLAQDPVWAERARQFSARVKDLSEWLAAGEFKVQSSRLKEDRGSTAAGIANFKPQTSNSKVTYHDACHLAHAQRITAQPRALIEAVAGRNYVELPESDVCCGSAGSYNLTEPEMAARLQQRKIENILKTGANVVVTSNPGCLLQIQAGLRKAGAKDVSVVHIADFLDEA